MAEVGGGAAYAGYQKIDNGISQGLQNLTGIKAQENAAKRLADERKVVREQERTDEWMKTHQWEEFGNEITNYETFDDLSRVLYNDVKNQTTELYRKSVELRQSGKTLDADLMWNKYLKTKGAFKEFAKIQPILAEHNKEFVKAEQEGKVSGVDDDYLSFIQAQQNLDVKPQMIDGVLTYKVAFKDKDGNITDIKEMSHQDIVNNKYSYIPKNEILGNNGIVTNLLKNIGTRTYDEIKGDYKYTFQKWDDKSIAMVDSYMDGLMESDRTMADLYFQATGKKKFGNIKYRRRGEQDDFTEADKTKVKDWIKKQVEGGYSTKTSKDARDMTVSEKKEESRLSRVNQRTGGSGGDGLVNVSTDNIELADGRKATTFAVPKGFGIDQILKDDFGKAVKVTSDYNTAIVDENGGVFLSNGDTMLPLDETQQVFIANKIGLKTGEELRKLAKVKPEIVPNTPKVDTSKMTPAEKIEYYKNLNKTK